MRTRLLVLAAVVAAGAATGAGCSGSDTAAVVSTTAASAPAATTPDVAASDVPSSNDTAVLCEVWASIAGGAVGTDNAEPTSKEGWDSKVAWTKQLTDAAPADQQENAQAYQGVVERRADLFAEYGYMQVSELPADVRDQFIAENSADQAKANDFIAFTKETCA